MSDYNKIYVKPGRDSAFTKDNRELPGLPFDETNRVALWDIHPAHHEVAAEQWTDNEGYNQSIIIAGNSKDPNRVYAVADTPDVMTAINRGRLVQVDPPKAVKTSDKRTNE